VDCLAALLALLSILEYLRLYRFPDRPCLLDTAAYGVDPPGEGEMVRHTFLSSLLFSSLPLSLCVPALLSSGVFTDHRRVTYANGGTYPVIRLYERSVQEPATLNVSTRGSTPLHSLYRPPDVPDWSLSHGQRPVGSLSFPCQRVRASE
jgi:hypothetical protein